MIRCTPENLRDEVKSGVELRDKFMEHTKLLIERYHGGYYRSDRSPDRDTPENHAYEYVSIMLPSLIYDNPRCNVSVARPNEAETDAPKKIMEAMSGAGVMTVQELMMVMGVRDVRGLYQALGIVSMGEIGDAIEIALNRWSEDSEIADPLADIAMDFMFRFGVGMVVSDDQPGRQGSEMVPQKPVLCHVASHDFFMDSAARNANPMSNGGPRLMGHQWRADQDDLLDDPQYDADQVELLGVDTDLERHGEAEGWIQAPKRKEIVAWDVWVHEKGLTDEPGYNGSIYTLAVSNTQDGVSKRPRFLREPQPAFCPPWGPYVLFGAYRVPGSPYPLSPLAATAEQAEEVNAHVASAAVDARNYKNFAYGPSTNGADGDRIRRVGHGEYVGLDEPEKVGQMELGGVKPQRWEYISDARGRLDRRSGLSESIRGKPSSNTATAESIAQSGTQARMAGLKRAFRRGVARIFKSSAWHIFYGEGQVHHLGADGAKIGREVLHGGVTEQTRHFNFYDLSLSIDPLSMEHTDQALLQQRMSAAVDRLIAIAPLVTQYPYVRWQKPLQAIFDSLNVSEADEWIDFDMIDQMREQATAQPGLPGDVATMPGNESGMEQIGVARQIGSDAGQANGVAGVAA